MTKPAVSYVSQPLSSTVEAVDYGGSRHPINPRNDLADHSPDGFSWGYLGSGPAQLALAILADYTLDDQFALRHYQDFKKKFIATQDLDRPFELLVRNFCEWVLERIEADRQSGHQDNEIKPKVSHTPRPDINVDLINSALAECDKLFSGESFNTVASFALNMMVMVVLNSESAMGKPFNLEALITDFRAEVERRRLAAAPAANEQGKPS